MSRILLQILIRALGIAGVTCTVIGFQCKKHSRVIGLRTANEMLFALQYLLLGGYTGAFLNTVGSIRNIIFIRLIKKGKSTTVPRVFFGAFFIIISVLTYNGFPTILFCIGKLITTYIYGSKNMMFVRVMTVISCFMWVAYNLAVGAYEGVLSDVMTILSVIIAIVRIDIIPRKKAKSSRGMAK